MLPPEYNITDPFIHNVSTLDYITFFKLSTDSVIHFLKRFYVVRPNYKIPWTFFEDLLTLKITWSEVILIFVLSFLWTILRYWITDIIVKPKIKSCNLSPLNSHKLPESIWKCLYYINSFGFLCYVTLWSGRYNYFYQPISLWEGWQDMSGQKVYWDVYFIYFTQGSYYIHSIYATIYMDIWRKDSFLMIIHHFVALTLITLSYGSGHLLEGAFVLFLHDNTDLLLEITKICFYLQKRENGDYYPILHFIGNLAFIAFAVFWFIFRLYWYPLKLLYTTVYAGVYLGPQDSPFFPILGFMLVVVLFMNIYWFNFIIRMIIRVCTTGEEPEDNREFDTASVIGVSRKELEIMVREGKINKNGKIKKD
uniref:Probable ceramide synthase lagr-1 (inferred by orthology to a C. elegans protein) n=1 Tax=Strongyloides venezuelensis TaxID=75913 RepID=A0A0K0G437_STRVS